MFFSLENRIWKVVLLVSFVLPLTVFAYLGFYTRYFADDFCTANVAFQYGLFGSVGHWYTTWAGQFTNFLVKGLIAYVGPTSAPLLPISILILWLAITIWALYQFGRLLSIKHAAFLSFLLGAMIVYAVFDGTPSIIQSLYWIGASIPYTIPMTYVIFYLGFLAYWARKKSPIPLWAYLFTAVTAFLVGGSSELTAIFHIAILGLVLLGIVFFANSSFKRNLIPFVITAILFMSVAMIISILAPGNAIRQAGFGGPLPFSTFVQRTLVITASYMATALAIYAPIPLALCTLLPAIVISRMPFDYFPYRLTPGNVRKLLAISVAVAFLLVLVGIAPPIYGTHSAPPPRAYIFPHFIMVCLAIFWGIVMGLGTRRAVSTRSPRMTAVWFSTAFIALLLIVGPGLSTVRALSKYQTFTTFAVEWDERDSQIRKIAASGLQDIKVQPLSYDLAAMSGLDPIEPDPTRWLNKCVAVYYGVKSISTNELEMADKMVSGTQEG